MAAFQRGLLTRLDRTIMADHASNSHSWLPPDLTNRWSQPLAGVLKAEG
jgi:hypothetical protein